MRGSAGGGVRYVEGGTAERRPAGTITSCRVAHVDSEGVVRPSGRHGQHLVPARPVGAGVDLTGAGRGRERVPQRSVRTALRLVRGRLQLKTHAPCRCCVLFCRFHGALRVWGQHGGLDSEGLPRARPSHVVHVYVKDGGGGGARCRDQAHSHLDLAHAALTAIDRAEESQFGLANRLPLKQALHAVIQPQLQRAQQNGVRRRVWAGRDIVGLHSKCAKLEPVVERCGQGHSGDSK